MTSQPETQDAPAETRTPAPAKPTAAAKAEPETAVPAIPTGFPEPVTPEPERERPADGKVRLAPQGFGSLTVPPLEEGGESVVITAEGTDCDEETARRAHEAARLAGFTLREL